ncbi:MAG: hypothetical protein QGH47_02115 [Candidatus Woesearchaeota archaeon]|jgi:hypothetical protein|nr:hypothetical protein [Candidatus Woesearchaeota archaeon]|tara:strand:+ start:451 stop:750 length:300 start_codon:yes stop_codon:yes gene_type:complete
MNYKPITNVINKVALVVALATTVGCSSRDTYVRGYKTSERVKTILNETADILHQRTGADLTNCLEVICKGANQFSNDNIITYNEARAYKKKLQDPNGLE